MLNRRRFVPSLLLSTLLLVSSFACSPSATPTGSSANGWQPVDYRSVTLSEEQIEYLDELEDKAGDLYDDEDYAGCAEAYAAALEIYDGNDRNHYNHACCLALAGQPDEALVALEKAVASGWWSTASFETDDDLATVRELPGYSALTERTEAIQAAYAQNDPLAQGSYSPKPAETPEPFTSLDELEEHFSELRAEMREPEFRALGGNARRDRTWKIAGEHVAALREFAQAHSDSAERAEMWALDILAGLSPTPKALEGEITTFLEQHGDGPLAGHAEMKQAIQPWGWTKLIWDDEAEGRDEKWAEVLTIAEAIEARDPTAIGARDANLFLLLDAQERNDHEAIGAHYRRLDENWSEDTRFWNDHGYQLNAARLIAKGVPEFDVQTIDNARWTDESLAGKVTLIDFWGTWCGPCIAEIPHLKELYAERHDQGFEILGISAEDGEEMTLDSFREWLAEREMTWPQHYDGLMRESEIIKKFEIRGYPTTILVNREGQIVAVNLRGEELSTKVAEII